MNLFARFEPLPERDELESRWRALEDASDAPFFLGWTWVGSWLESLKASPAALAPELLAVQDDGRDVALALVGRANEKRAFGNIPTLWFNQAGDSDADRPFIEYNGLLMHSDHAQPACDAALAAIMARKDWKALRLSGVTPDTGLKRAEGFRRWTQRDTSPVYYIDLDAVRGAGGDYLSLLSANSRTQIRRSLKDLNGPMEVEVARSPDEIDAWLGAMQTLNVGRHADNAWDHAAFRAFARTITLNGLADGQVELLRLHSAGDVIGYLLNFRYRGQAMNYQSAFAAPTGPKSKPGLMCHSAAVKHYADQHFSVYSLLAGKDRYKQSLSTGAEQMEWWTGERFGARLEAEALIRKLLRR